MDRDGTYLMEVFDLKFLVLVFFNTSLSHGMKHYLYLYGHHHKVESIVILHKKNYSCLVDFYVGKKRGVSTLNLFEFVEVR